MTNFDRKAERCKALGKAYQSVLEIRQCISDNTHKYNRPTDEYLAIQFDTLTEVMKVIEEML